MSRETRVVESDLVKVGLVKKVGYRDSSENKQFYIPSKFQCKFHQNLVLSQYFPNVLCCSMLLEVPWSLWNLDESRISHCIRDNLGNYIKIASSSLALGRKPL